MATSYETFEEADHARDPETEMVCGVRMEDESARYFVLPKDTPDEVGHAISFEIRHGRPMSQYERWIREVATDLKSKDADVQEAVDA